MDRGQRLIVEPNICVTIEDGSLDRRPLEFGNAPKVRFRITASLA
jgi:hypothetical protein